MKMVLYTLMVIKKIIYRLGFVLILRYFTEPNSKSKVNDLVKKKLNKNNLLRSKNIIKLWKEFSISKYNYPHFIDPQK